jgi:hypothetical protein
MRSAASPPNTTAHGTSDLEHVVAEFCEVNRTNQPVVLSVGQEGAAPARRHASARPPLTLQPPSTAARWRGPVPVNNIGRNDPWIRDQHRHAIGDIGS